MKYRVLLSLMAVSISFTANTQTPILVSSGQNLYFNLITSPSYSPADGYASVTAPNYNSIHSNYDWTGYAQPGGDVIIPDTVLYNGLKYAVTEVEAGAFKGCESMTSIVVPNTVNLIKGEVFYGCSALRSITIGSGVEKIAIPSGYGYFSGVQIIANCPNLNTIYFNADSCYMGSLFGAAGDIGQHTTVIVGDSVRFISGSMFRKPTSAIVSRSIESVIIGRSVASIGGGAFLDCSDLKSVTFRSLNPPLLGASVFGGVNRDSVLCYIPCGRTSVYYDQWSNLFNYIEDSTSYSLIVSSNYDSWGIAEVIQQPSCNGDAIIGATASCGYYFVRWSDGNTDNPRTLTLQNDTYLTAIFASSYNVPDTVFIYDTTTVNNYIHDTTYLPIYLHDTIYLQQFIHDTTYVDVPYSMHDTIIITDTTIVTDTLWLPGDTVYIDHFDTITIHDTVYVGVDEVDAISAKIYTSHGQIVVESVDGMPLGEVYVFDMMGRQTPSPLRGTPPNLGGEQQRYQFDVPASGTYLVKIGDLPARKVVIIR